MTSEGNSNLVKVKGGLIAVKPSEIVKLRRRFSVSSTSWCSNEEIKNLKSKIPPNHLKCLGVFCKKTCVDQFIFLSCFFFKCCEEWVIWHCNYAFFEIPESSQS